MQSSELAQAESLEREAQMHRDRAMGGGGEHFESRARRDISRIDFLGGVNLANSNFDRQPNN